MKEIRKDDISYIYGDERLYSAEDVYAKLQKEYNNAKGRSAYNRLNRLGQRKERVHGTWSYYSQDYDFGNFPDVKIKGYFLGLIGTTYCKTIGAWDIPYEIDDYEAWSDWIFRKGGKELRIVGTRLKVGRTAVRKKKNKS